MGEFMVTLIYRFPRNMTGLGERTDLGNDKSGRKDLQSFSIGIRLLD